MSRIDAEKSFFLFKNLSFEGGAKPIETKYTMTAQMRAANGSNLGGAFVETISADFTGRIRRIRIRENNNDLNFRIIVDENIDQDEEQAAFVKIEFNDAFGNPLPIPSTSIATLSRTIEDKQLNRYTYSPLTFEGGARPLEDIYNVTATMLRADGTPIYGGSLTSDIVIEDNIMKSSALISSQIVSYDQGKNWTIIVKYQNPEPWVEAVEVEFVGPFEGSDPSKDLIKLSPSGEEPAGVMIYSNAVSFKGDPVGFSYNLNIVAFGGGQRTHPIGLRLGISKGWESNTY